MSPNGKPTEIALTAETVERLFEYLGNLNAKLDEDLPRLIKSLVDQGDTDRRSLQSQIDRLRQRVDNSDAEMLEVRRMTREALSTSQESVQIAREYGGNVGLFKDLYHGTAESLRVARQELELMKQLVGELQNDHA